jgi:hypothetical protein
MLLPFGNLVAILYIFPRFGMHIVSRKIWQPWVWVEENLADLLSLVRLSTVDTLLRLSFCFKAFYVCFLSVRAVSVLWFVSVASLCLCRSAGDDFFCHPFSSVFLGCVCDFRLLENTNKCRKNKHYKSAWQFLLTGAEQEQEERGRKKSRMTNSFLIRQQKLATSRHQGCQMMYFQKL